MTRPVESQHPDASADESSGTSQQSTDTPAIRTVIAPADRERLQRCTCRIRLRGRGADFCDRATPWCLCDADGRLPDRDQRAA